MLKTNRELELETELKQAFKQFDLNGDGYIVHSELFEVMSKIDPTVTKREIEGMITDADTNEDGRVSYEGWWSFKSEKVEPIFVAKCIWEPFLILIRIRIIYS